MSIKGKIKTLFSDKNKTEVLFPRTKVSAVSDDNGVGLNVLLEQTVPMARGGTGAENGAEGLANMFAAGSTVLSPYQYGTELPANPAVGQVYFEEATGTIADIGQDVAKAVRAVNLLDNSDFRNPVNQRGASGTIPTWTYCIDRWRTGSNTATISINNGLVCTGYISQVVAPNCNGKTITFAAKINGEIFCCSAEIYTVNSWTQFARKDTNVGSMAICKWDDNVMYVEIHNTSQGTIEWAALYEGEYTAETLPPYVPKGYTAEWIECRRYFRRYRHWLLIGNGYVSWEGVPYLNFAGEPPMRTTPTCSRFFGYANTINSGFDIDETPTASFYGSNIQIAFSQISSENYNNSSCAFMTKDTNFDLSADL